ncbi:MAG: ABC transporter substrate-binding protein, partial [bacterium]
GGKGGEEPKGDLKKAIKLYDEAIKTTNAAKRLSLAKEIIRLNSENLWTIGTVGLAPATMGVGVVKNNFRNVPEKALSDVTLSSPGNTHPEQYFFEK